MDEERIRPIDIGGSLDSLHINYVRVPKQLRGIQLEFTIVTRQREGRAQQHQQSQNARSVMAKR